MHAVAAPAGLTPSATSPAQRLDGLARALADAAGHDVVLRGRPRGQGWWRLAEIGAQVETWHEALARSTGDRRAAAMFLTGWTLTGPTALVGLPAVLADAVPVVAATDVAHHRHPEGWFDAHALAPDRVVGHDEASAAEVLADLLVPLVDRLTAALPVGTPAAWGAVADGLGGRVLVAARAAGADVPAAWARTLRLLDELQAHVPALRLRPRLVPVDWSGGTHHVQRRATCCLFHRTCAMAPDDASTCSTCPLRDEASRQDRIRTWLERTG